MAENENQTAVAAPASESPESEPEYQYNIQIEDAGPATKRVVVEIPKERIDQKLTEQYKDLRQQAAIPGFRPGHAPQKLIEKRFASDVKEQVRRNLISESYQQAVEKNDLQVLGEPEFDNPDAIQLKEDQGLKYSFQIEVQPAFTVPDLSTLTVKKPKIQVTDENVQQALQNLKEQQGMLVPVEDRGVEDKDYVTADIHVKADGNVIAHQHDAQIVSRPGRIAGIDVVDLDKQLSGAKSGEARTIKVKVPETHPTENVRGKEVEIEVAVKDIKHLELREINQEFLDELGFRNEQELLDALREQMEERITFDIKQSMREQVNKFLIDNTSVDLPTKLSDRQADRVVNRRAVDLMMRGLPREQIEANIERLRTGAKDEAIRELKLFFILQKVAADQNVDVDESELNGRIAMLAAQRGARPEKMKQQMAKDGTLANLYVQMREEKAVDKLLENAKVEEVDLQTNPAEQHSEDEKKD
jgi:trigger factor